MAEILPSDITSGYIDGEGVFDLLMTAIGSNIQKEYQENRIQGSDYSTVYLGSLQAVLQQTIQFLLGKQKADKEADLIAQQILESQAKVTRDDELADSKIALDTAQKNKINAEISLINAQVDKINAEICLLEAKCATEQAQILDTVNGKAVVGLVGKQKNLYQKQGDGFDRDAEQKVLKLLVDMYTVAKSADPDATVTMDWFATGSTVYDDFRLAVSEAVENAGLRQIYPSN